MKIFDGFYKNSDGVWFFSPADETAYASGKPTSGFGCIKYGEGSVYTGEVYFDGKRYEKLGAGQQDFSRSSLGGLVTDDDRLYKFVGEYDYNVTGWICGRGVMYYVDADGKPSHFTVGRFSGLDLVGDDDGFDYSTLLSGYTRDMEWKLDYSSAIRKRIFKRVLGAARGVKRIDTLFLGDSYFEFWTIPEYCGAEATFDKTFGAHDVNLGVGGTKYIDWIEYLDAIKDFPKPRKILINLGFNDLHGGKSPDEVLSDAKKFVEKLRQMFPSVPILRLTTVHSPLHPRHIDAENAINALLDGLFDRQIDTCTVLSYEKYFHADGTHLNPRGYAILTDIVKKALAES